MRERNAVDIEIPEIASDVRSIDVLTDKIREIAGRLRTKHRIACQVNNFH